MNWSYGEMEYKTEYNKKHFSSDVGVRPYAMILSSSHWLVGTNNPRCRSSTHHSLSTCVGITP